MLRIGEDVVGRAVLDDPSGVHDGQALAGGGEHRQVVGDEQQCQSAVALQFGEQVEHLSLHHHVERGGGLVGDQQARLAGERQRDQHPLALPARQLVREGTGTGGGDAHSVEQFLGAAPRRSRRVVAVQQDRLVDLVADALHGVERVQCPLEHDRRGRPTDGAEASWLHRPHVLAVEQDLALDERLFRQQPQHGTGNRGLAAARLAGQADGLARFDREVDAAHRRHRAESLTRPVGDAQVAQLEQAHPRPRSRSLGSRISSIARPIRVNDSTTATMPMPLGR